MFGDKSKTLAHTAVLLRLRDTSPLIMTQFPPYEGQV